MLNRPHLPFYRVHGLQLLTRCAYGVANHGNMMALVPTFSGPCMFASPLSYEFVQTLMYYSQKSQCYSPMDQTVMLPCALLETHRVRPGMSFSVCADPEDYINQSYEVRDLTGSAGRLMVVQFKKFLKICYRLQSLEKGDQRRGWKN